jgi:hypothetical protein
MDAASKLNQHSPQVQHALHQIYRQGKSQEQALALWMTGLGLKTG